MRSAILLVILSATFLTCKKSKQEELIPQVPVNINIYITDPAYSALQSNTGTAYVNGGSKGIIVYRHSELEFKAYDRHCPYKVSDACQVKFDASGIQAFDTCCKSSFVLIDGSVSAGPSPYPLKRYNVEVDGSRLQIYN